MKWYLKVVRDNYANFSGRARRKEYWMFTLFNYIISFAVGFTDGLLGITPYEDDSILVNIYILVVMIPTIAVGIRRVHDVGKSGWFILIPFYNFILFITDSQPGNNEYGPNPKSQHAESVEDKTIIETNPGSNSAYEDDMVEAGDIPEPIVLTVDSGANKGSFYPVSGETTIGRAHDNDIVLEQKTVSGYHCKISIEEGQFIIYDLNSTNGTKVDGLEIKQALIDDGSVIDISKVRLKVTS